MNKLSELARERKWKYFEVRGKRAFAVSGTPAVAFYGHTLDLRNGAEDLLTRFKGSARGALGIEPQPEDAGTIFPFWVGDGDERGYVELPYTLVQDSTLFLFLREASIDIWKRKLDWIVEKGGMALLITYPDYIEFGVLKNERTYHASLYQEFLGYVSTRYGGQFWHALPINLAQFFNNSYALENRRSIDSGLRIMRMQLANDSRSHPPASCPSSSVLPETDLRDLGNDA